jgi:cytochrome c oxidase assembly factor CtaG
VTVAGAWILDPTVLLIVSLAVGYGHFLSMAGPAKPVRWPRCVCFATGLVVWTLALTSPLAVYAPLLFWVRALQVLMLLLVVPFLLALGAPVKVLRAAVNERNGQRIDMVLASRAARVACSPALTSALMLASPWLLYMTPWYVASLSNSAIGKVTSLALTVIGFAYFYARLQVDPVPRRYTPLLAMGISVIESLADGLLGLVLWLGPLIAHDYYAGLHRSFGPSMRTDQTLGAGILWILGDVFGIPFVVVLMRALGFHERARTAEVDAVLDTAVDCGDEASNGLWWSQDPQLRDRFARRHVDGSA